MKLVSLAKGHPLRKLRKKINKNAFSGGGKTEEEQRANGANLDVDVAYQWLS